MSRIGKNPVAVPSGVTVTLNKEHLTVKGPKGELSLIIPNGVKVSHADNQLVVEPTSDSKESRALWGTIRARINNMVVGVTQEFTKNLELVGVGYRAAVQGQNLQLQLGFSHDILYPIPAGIKVVCEKQTSIAITGVDKQVVGQIAANIRSYRPPEPYKGKGVKYAGEVILRKEGKK